MTIILLILNIALIWTCCACVLACSHIRGKTAYLMGAYIISYADVVLILELAGLLSAISPMPVLALQILLTAVAALVWLRAGRPPLLRPFVGPRLPQTSIANLLRVVRQPPLLKSLVIILAGGVAYVYFRRAELILVVPPSNWDSLTYHLSRVGYWLQYKSFYPWPSPFLPQTTLPMNGELGALWTILWWGTDQLAGFVQWSAVPSIVLGIYGLTRLLGCSRWQSALVALLWPTLTLVMFESSTTQNDLVSASFCVATFYFLFAGWREKGEPYPYLSGLALGLALGTKGTILLALPGLACASLLVIWHRRGQQEVKSFVFRWIAACVLSVFLFGSYIFVQNTLAFGGPLGPLGSSRGPIDLGTVDLGATDLIPTIFRLLRDNAARHVYRLVDFSPLPLGAAATLNPLKAAAFSSVFQLLHIQVENQSTVWNEPFSLQAIYPLNEDTSWFGPLAAVLMLAVLYQIARAVRHPDALRLTLIVIGVGYFAAQSALQLWDPALGRYYLIPIALAFPLMSDFLDTRTPWRGILASLLVLLGLIVMFNVTLTNNVLQGVSWRRVLADARRPPAYATEFTYRMVAENIPLSASMGIASSRDIRDYPFFGEHFTRRVTPAVPDDRSIVPRVDTARFADEFAHSDFLLIDGMQSHFIPEVASPAYSLLSVYNGISIWMRNDLSSPSNCDGQKWPFTDFFQSSSSEVCPRFPLVQGKVNLGYAPTSFLDNGQFVPAVSPRAKFEFSLLVKEPTTAKLRIQVAPRNTTPQTLQLLLSGGGSPPMLFSRSFQTRQALEFVVRLDRDIYQVQLSLASGDGQTSIEGFQVTTP